MFDESHIREEVASACRVLAIHGLCDLWCHVSARVPDSQLCVVTPRFGEEVLPRTVTANDLLVTDTAGNIVDGVGELPLQYAMVLAVYRRYEKVRACIFSSPKYAMAFGITRTPLRAVAHGQAELAYRTTIYEGDGLVLDDERAESFAQALGTNIACHQPGVGVFVAAASLLDALMYSYYIEYLAQASFVACAFPPDMRVIQREEADRVVGQRTSRFLHGKFFAELDPGPARHPWVVQKELWAPRTAADKLKAQMAFTARILWNQKSLVGFLEHISHRLPGTNRWLMTAAKPFGRMTPEDVSGLDYNGNWIDGPLPRPFKNFHRDIFVARPDAQAIVHTHEVFGRVYVLANQPHPRVFRNGLQFAGKALPVYPIPDLIFAPEPRAATVAALADGPVVHELGHGTDYVASTLEEATVNAIQREEALMMHNLALRLGTPRELRERTQREILTYGPSAKDWWWFYAGEVGQPSRSVAGL